MKKELKDVSKDKEILSLRKQISQKDKQIQAAEKLVHTKNEVIKETKNIIEGQQGLIKTSIMWMAYLISRLTDTGEITFPKEEVYSYLDKYDMIPTGNENGTITIKIVKKGEANGNT